MIYCQDCGAVNEPDSERFNQMREEIRELREQKANLKVQLEDAERDLRVKRSQISRLKGERNHVRTLDPSWPDAQRVFDYWRSRLMPKAREFGEDRADKVLARLHAGHPVEDLFRAIDGAAAKPFVVNAKRQAEGKPSDRYVDLELICRDEKHLTQFMNAVESPRDTSTVSEVSNNDRGLPALLDWTCGCGHSMAEHIPPKLLTQADQVFRLKVPGHFHPCAHGDCYCLNFDELEYRVEEFQSEERARLRREQMRAA